MGPWTLAKCSQQWQDYVQLLMYVQLFFSRESDTRNVSLRGVCGPRNTF